MNMVKMTILPKSMYKFQMLPIRIPQTYFQILKTLISTFIWQNKKQKIKFSVISKNKLQGGLNYNLVLISRVLDWTKDTKEKKWVQTEKQYVEHC